jgi:hypothetical protein
MRKLVVPLSSALLLSTSALATPTFVSTMGRPPADVPPFDVPGPPPGLSVPAFEVPVGPPDGVPPEPTVPAHGQFPLGDVPPVSPPVGPPAPVPEPGTAALLVAGLLGLAHHGRARRGARGW